MKVEANCQFCGKPLVLEIVPNEYLPASMLVCMATCNACTDARMQAPPRPAATREPEPPPEPSRVPYADS